MQSGDVAGELSFVLPSNDIHQYPALFDKLEGLLYTYKSFEISNQRAVCVCVFVFVIVYAGHIAYMGVVLINMDICIYSRSSESLNSQLANFPLMIAL